MAVTLAQFPLASVFVGQSVCSQPLHPVTQQLPVCKFPLCPGETPTANGPCGPLCAAWAAFRDSQLGLFPAAHPEPRGSPGAASLSHRPQFTLTENP